MMSMTVRIVTQAIVLLALVGVGASVSAQSWVNQSSMKQPRVEATTVDYRDDIYVFNGFKAGLQLANSVEKYDAGTKKWSTISATSTVLGNAVTHNGVVRVGADVWIIGGRIGRHPGRVSDDVWIFNLNSKKWRKGPELPLPVAAGGAALVNNKIHWIGGLDRNASCDVSTHVIYDLDKPAVGWKNITSSAGMPSPRNHFSTAVVNGVIYAMGGQFGHDACPGKRTNDTALVHAYNTKTNKWSRKADMPSKNSHSEPGTFVYKGDIYTTGGESAKNKVWKYNPRSNKWSTFKTLAEDLIAPIARIVDGHIIVAGGGAPIAQQPTNKVRSLHVDSNPPKPQPEPIPEPIPEPEPEPGSNTPQGATLISMEAEYFDDISSTSTHQWQHIALGDSSNDDAMITTPDQGELAGSAENTPMLSYLVYFNYPGKHYIWVRGLGDTNSSGVGNSDSIQVGLNGTLASTAYRIDRFPDQWSWSRHTPSNPVASLNIVNAGVNAVNFWMREDGLAFDKFVITSDPDFVPKGFGPEVTDGSADYIPPAPTDGNDATAGDSNDDVATEPDSTADDQATTGSTDTDPVISDVTGTDQLNPIDDQPADINTAIAGGSSGSGLFGGSASLNTLLALLAICVVRIRQQRNTY